jgi:hypothetical protein
MEPITAATAALGIGTSMANKAGDLIFGEMLQKQQLRGQKKSLEQQNAASYDYWLKTNYDAQKGQMKEAGLNPGLMYGMGGGAGGQSSNASGQGAPGGNVGQMDIAGQAQVALMKAQKENIEADTANKKAEVPVKGATVPKLGAETENLKQQTENKKLEAIGQALDNKLDEIEISYQGATLADRIASVRTGLESMNEQLAIIKNNREISDNTKETLVKQAKAELALTLVDAEAKRMGMKVDSQMIKESIERIANMVNPYIEQGIKQDAIQVQKDRLAFDKEIHNVSDATKLTVETIGEIIEAVGLGSLAKKLMGSKEIAPKKELKPRYRKWGTMTAPGGYDLK